MAVPHNDAVEALLEKAAPRPAPPGSAEQDIRAAVRTEWTRVTTQRRRRRMTVRLAMAASVTLVLAFSLASLRETGIVPVEVASIDKSLGTVYLQSGGSVQSEAIDTSSILSGQILTTGTSSTAGLKWLNGGSLRIDGNTRIEFVAGNEVYLHEGKIYFDSFGATPGNDFSIRSAHGIVSHVGTQYMTESNAASLIVSVREGEVAIDGTYHDQKVFEGQRVQMTGSAQPSVTNTSGVGAEWQWAETVSPNISVDGMSVFEFLQWVGRETGHAVQFKSVTAETLARNSRLKGTVNAEPRTELRLRMLTVDLEARFDSEGSAIIVSD